jgi:hypothetical protein
MPKSYIDYTKTIFYKIYFCGKGFSDKYIAEYYIRLL